jgi:hypothetical protein
MLIVWRPDEISRMGVCRSCTLFSKETMAAVPEVVGPDTAGGGVDDVQNVATVRLQRWWKGFALRRVSATVPEALTPDTARRHLITHLLLLLLLLRYRPRLCGPPCSSFVPRRKMTLRL